MSNARVDTVVHGGLVVSAAGAFEASVAIQGERVAAVGPLEMMPPAGTYIDATGKYVLPGPIDCHVHLGGAEDWTRGAAAAAYSGLTTLISFAIISSRSEETLPQAIARLQQEAGRQSVVDFAFHFVLTNRPYLLEGLPEAVRMGVTSFKMFMAYKKTPARMCSDGYILRAMEAVAGLGGLVQLHCENGEVIDYLEDRAMADGRVHPRDFPATGPAWAEEEAVGRAVQLADLARCPLYVVHLSTKGGLEHVMRAQNAGQRVWAETCPQYLLLNETEMERLGPYAKIGPPLRPADGVHQEALWRGLQSGHVSVVASDHAPATSERKEPGWKNVFVGPDGLPVPFGAPTMETLVSLAYSEGVVKRGLPISWLARVLSENPARLFGLYPRKGVIRPGSDADLLLWDPKPERTIRAADLHGSAGFDPYEGWQVHGQPWLSLLRGRVLLSDGKLEAGPGYGQFLRSGAFVPAVGGRAV